MNLLICILQSTQGSSPVIEGVTGTNDFLVPKLQNLH